MRTGADNARTRPLVSTCPRADGTGQHPIGAVRASASGPRPPNQWRLQTLGALAVACGACLPWRASTARQRRPSRVPAGRRLRGRVVVGVGRRFRARRTSCHNRQLCRFARNARSMQNTAMFVVRVRPRPTRATTRGPQAHALACRRVSPPTRRTESRGARSGAVCGAPPAGGSTSKSRTCSAPPPLSINFTNGSSRFWVTVIFGRSPVGRCSSSIDWRSHADHLRC